MENTKKQVAKDIERAIAYINEIYDGIDELNGALYEIVNHGERAINEVEEEFADSEHFTSAHKRINDFYMRLTTYSELDDMKDMLNRLKEDLEEKEAVK